MVVFVLPICCTVFLDSCHHRNLQFDGFTTEKQLVAMHEVSLVMTRTAAKLALPCKYVDSSFVTLLSGYVAMNLVCYNFQNCLENSYSAVMNTAVRVL